MKTIWMIEDDVMLGPFVKDALEKKGYRVILETQYTSLRKGDILVLDIGLDKQSGFAIMQEVRTLSNMPIVVLTGHDTLEEEIKGLRLGANDYVYKPCPLPRLLARIERFFIKEKSILEYKGLCFDVESHKLTYLGQYCILQQNEGKLMALFMQKEGDIVRVEEIKDALWQGVADDNLVQVTILRLRKRLDQFHQSLSIMTIRKEGYKLDVQ